MTLFKSDCVLICNGSLKSTSLIGINISAFYGWFTHLDTYINCSFTLDRLKMRSSSVSLNPNTSTKEHLTAHLLFWQEKWRSLTCAVYSSCLSPPASWLWNKEQLFSENRSHKQEYWLQLLELGPIQRHHISQSDGGRRERATRLFRDT